MPTRRELLQAGAAAAAIIAAEGLGDFRRVLAQQQLTETELLNFSRLGNVTLLHVADLQLQGVARDAEKMIGGIGQGNVQSTSGA